MQNNLRDEHVKTLWQNQPTEKPTMSMILIRQKARDLHAKTRRHLLGSLAAPAVVVFLYVFCMNQFHQLPQGEHALFALALAWSIVGLVLLNRGKWSAEMPEDAGFSTGLEFCRGEIERRRDYFRRVLLWQLGPVILAIGTPAVALMMASGTGIASKAVPFLTLLVVWIVAYLLFVARKRRELQRELKELSEMESETSR
jgi:hypothetical protein